MAVKAILADRLYLPDVPIVRERVDALYSVPLYNEGGCRMCGFVKERPCDQCEGCPNNEGSLALWKPVTIQGKPKIGVPVGDRVLLKKLVGKTQIEIDDRRSKPRMRGGIKLTAELYPYQKKAVAQLLKTGRGILQSPPRSGKTLMTVALSLRLGLRTIILASKIDLLEQFEKEYRERTNINAREDQCGHKLVGVCGTVEDMEGMDVVLCTYQIFFERFGPKLQQVKRMFGLVVTDEVHDGAAIGFAKVLASFHAKYRFGLSATPRRKDGRMHIVFTIVGPVTAKTEVEAMTPRLQLVETPAKAKTKYKTWLGAMNFLFKHEQRNKLIIAHAVHDIRQGRTILIPTTQVKHAKLLADGINAKLGETVALALAGSVLNSKKKRRAILQDAREGKIKCIVGSRTVVQVGLNIPIASMLYVVAPINNEPKFVQETTRVCTKMDGKPQPVIKHFIDPGLKQAVNSFSSMFSQVYKPRGVIMSEETRKKARAYSLSMRFAGQSPILFKNRDSGGIV